LPFSLFCEYDSNHPPEITLLKLRGALQIQLAPCVAPRKTSSSSEPRTPVSATLCGFEGFGEALNACGAIAGKQDSFSIMQRFAFRVVGFVLAAHACFFFQTAISD